MNKNLTYLLLLVVCSFVLANVFGVSEVQAMVNLEKAHPSQAENLSPTFEKVVVTTQNNWYSETDRIWIVDVEGTPEQIYVVDQEALEEISHTETIHHAAVTHQEDVLSTGPVYYILYYVESTDAMETEYKTFADDTAAESWRMAYDETATDRFIEDFYSTGEQGTYVSGTQTVVDQEAYDETITVIDQQAREEIGHYETIIVGEEGHWENSPDVVVGDGSGYFEAVVKKSKE